MTVNWISGSVDIYQNQEDGRILIQPKMGNAVIYNDGIVEVLGSGIISMQWYQDADEKTKWKKVKRLVYN